jgi:PadR family transcriptional regulator PadR
MATATLVKGRSRYSSRHADFSLEITTTPSSIKQSPGSFLTVLLDLTSKDRAKFPVAFQKETCHHSCGKPKRSTAMKEKADVLQGTLTLMVLKTLDVLGTLHGYGIARRVEQISGDLLALNQGTLYPLLLKLEHEGSIASQWGASENNRRARFYRLTAAGRRQLEAETRDWEQSAAIIARFFRVKAEDLT